MPELRAAIRAGLVRGELRIACSPAGLGPAYPVALALDEEIVARVPLAFEDTPNEGEAIVIVNRAALPRLKITADDPRVVELARVLAGYEP